jgi:UDP-glucuronate 4-epimerase
VTVAPLTGKRLLVTGVTGWVGGPLALQLAAAGNTMYGASRFADDSKRAPFESEGVHTIKLDLESGDLAEFPDGIDLVLNFAVSKDPSFNRALAANAHGSANLMELAVQRNPAVTFFQCSSTAVYQPAGQSPRSEDDPLGDSHRAMGMETYAISKITSEVLVRHTARRLGVPSVVARLNVPYGDRYGWPLFHLMMMERSMAVPVHVDAPSSYAPIHADDITASIPYLLAFADPETPTVNWGGDEVTSVEAWCALMGDWTGLTPTFAPTEKTVPAIVPDLAKQRSTGFRCSVGWREGFRRMVETSRPDLVK